MSLSDIRKIQHEKYTKHKIQNIYPTKYENFWRNQNKLISSSDTIVRYLKRNWFKDCYDAIMESEKHAINYKRNNNGKAGILFFRYIDFSGTKQVISLLDKTVDLTQFIDPVRVEQYYKQKRLCDNNTNEGINYIQKMEYQTSIVKDDSLNMKITNYVSFIINNVWNEPMEINEIVTNIFLRQCKIPPEDYSIKPKIKRSILTHAKIQHFVNEYKKILRMSDKYPWIVSFFTKYFNGQVIQNYSKHIDKCLDDLVFPNIEKKK